MRKQIFIGAIVALALASAREASAQYAGLIITEVASQPTADEYVEVFNSNASGSISLVGVVISDEDDNNTEGALKFPTGATINAQEAILVTMNNSTAEPAWLDSLPSGIKVFVEPARSAGLPWSPPGGVTVTLMDEFAVIDGGTSSSIAISGGDGVALYKPGTTFIPGPAAGPLPTTNCIDGMNYNNTDAGARCPINTTGFVEPMLTRVGTDEPAAGSGYHRNSTATNTASDARFAQATRTPGTTTLATSDLTPPGIQTVSPSGTNQVIIQFTEAVQLATSETEANYELDPGNLVPTSAVRTATNTVTLTYGVSLTRGLLYTQSVQNVQDLSANPMLLSTKDFNFFSSGLLVITEIYYNPDQDGANIAEATAEFFEVFNPGAALDISGYTLKQGNSGVFILDATGGVTTVPAQSYFTFGRLNHATNGGVIHPYEIGSPGNSNYSLGNSGGTIELLDDLGNLVDSVTYTDSTPWPDDNPDGTSIEFIVDPTGATAADLNDTGSNWAKATAMFGTAGGDNRATPGTGTFAPAASGVSHWASYR